jgi:DNA repair exonuclease SbcCD ATPase subunit
MPENMNFTLDELLKQKEDLVAKLTELENNNVELDEIVDDKEIIAEIRSLKKDIKEVSKEISEVKQEVKQEVSKEISEVKQEVSKEISEVKQEDNLETKIINIINNTKQQRVLNKYKKEVELLVHKFTTYMDNLLDDYEKVRIITKKDIQEMNDEYQSLRNEFEAEFSTILNKLPEGTDFDKSVYQYIVGTFQEIEDDLDSFKA